MKTKTLFTNYIPRLLARFLLCVSLVISCFAISQMAQAVLPAPDGGYPGGNTAEGQSALLSLTSGGYNTAVGFLSLASDTVGAFNTAIGAGTLLANTANDNTAIGAGALLSNATGDDNTASGMFALFSNTGGSLNTATGSHALFSNTGTANTADGTSALLSNTTGHDNTANGLSALYSNTIGSNNTASGSGALFGNLDGDSNTAVGAGALLNNTSGASNTATGLQALYFNTTGSNNIAFGAFAGYNLTGGSDNIEIGNGGDAGDTSTIRIGEPATQNRAFIAGIHGVTTGNGDAIAVLIDSAGQLGTMSSSARFKKNVKTMGEASEAILALNPVTFQYKTDKTGIPQFGLIAEEVAQVNPDLVVRDKNGEIYSVRYDAVNAMLLNEFLKEHKKVEQLEGTVASLAATVKEQAAQIQKVSAQLATTKPAPQVVNNP